MTAAVESIDLYDDHQTDTSIEQGVVQTLIAANNDLKRLDTLARAFYHGARASESTIFWEWPVRWRDLHPEQRATIRAGVVELLAEQKFEAEIYNSL